MRRLGEEIGELSKRRRIAIASHPSADPDSISSAIAVSALARWYSQRLPCYIHRGGLDAAAKKIYEEALTRGYIEECPSEPDKAWALVLVDTPCRRASTPCEGFEVVYVIDHHLSSEEPQGVRGVVEPGASSTTELCTLMLRENSVGLETPHMANLVLAGILYDTKGLSLASIVAIEATAYLMRWGARVGDALQLLRKPPGVDERIARLKAMSRARIYRAGNTILCITRVGAYEASAAQILMSGGCDIAVVISEKDEGSRVVARCSEELCGGAGLGELLLEELSRAYGGGWGGHRLAAVATVRASYEDLEGEIPKILGRRLGAEFRPLDV